VSIASPFQGTPAVEGSEEALPGERIIWLVYPDANTTAVGDSFQKEEAVLVIWE
jgi:hypothetical protein